MIDDSIDTVLTVFPDLQGRLVGKRITAHYFRDHVEGDGVHMCNYLLAVDVDMTPVPGYTFANWDEGYGDVKAVPDMATLRTIPWLENTALVMCDLVDEHEGAPVAVSPRAILKHQIARAAAAGFAVKIGAELEFFLFKDSYEAAKAKRYHDLTPHSDWIEDYHILQTTRDEYLIRQIRNGMDGAGVPVEFSKGEAGRGQHEINLEYADALEMADRHAIYKNGAKEIAALNDRSITFMAKWSMSEVGSSCHLHSSLWSTDGEVPMADAAAPHYWLGGLLDATRELAWCFAPYVNSYKRYQPGSWAPTALVWGEDNRTCAFRMVGQGAGRRVESRVPGADCNPYLAYAATIAAGLHGIARRLDPGPAFVGNAYVAGEEVARVPSTLVESIGEFARSEVALEAFGPDVHAHLLNTARQEWATANQVVTDWERERGFERL
jgi:glutamine synthetase